MKNTWTRKTVPTNVFNLEGYQTIININVASCLDNLGDILVVEPQNFLITFLFELIVKCDLDGFTLLQLNLGGATLNKNRRKLIDSEDKITLYNYLYSNLTTTHSLDESGPDFWSLSVQSDGHWSVVNRSRSKTLSCLTDIFDGLSMVLFDVG